MPANLTYYIYEGVLTGTANGHMIHVSAVSGGGGGSKLHGGNNDTNNPYSQGVKTTGSGNKHVHGGPLPTGRYKIATPARNPHLGLAAQLDPYDDAQAKHMLGRDGFYIHGRGPHGSDGCIVPMEQFAELMAALTKDRGGVLYVLEAMGGDRFV